MLIHLPINENLSTTEVILDATDQDGDSLTYGLSGTDSDKFMIDPADESGSTITQS